MGWDIQAKNGPVIASVFEVIEIDVNLVSCGSISPKGLLSAVVSTSGLLIIYLSHSTVHHRLQGLSTDL